MRVIVEREPEFDEEQYQLLAAFADYEGSLNELGIPMDEAMSPDADPSNPNRKYTYVTDPPYRDFAVDSVEKARKPYTGDGSRALRFKVRRVDR